MCERGYNTGTRCGNVAGPQSTGRQGSSGEAMSVGDLHTSHCFDYSSCNYYNFSVCDDVHPGQRYGDASSVWVLIAAMIVFFMKAGFMLVELSFAHELKDQRNVVVVKYIDACASAFGFFLIGFDAISRYLSPQGVSPIFFGLTGPVLFFFKFTFASNAATIIGGCLVTSKYKLRLPAAFISAFVISGILHPLIAFLIWSDHCNTLSAYRFCQDTPKQCGFSCNNNSTPPLLNRLYVLDFAGGGAVHLVGGIAGLVLCLFAKFQKWKSGKFTKRFKIHFKKSRELQAPLVEESSGSTTSVVEENMKEEPEEPVARNFLEWMYPPSGGSEKVGEAALGVIILWFCWFAFNCGSTSSVESNFSHRHGVFPYYSIPAIIAINMIMATATGGITAICIAVWAQLYSRTVSVNANEIANGIMTSLVAITAGCPFVDYWGACVIGFVAVILYHVGCFLEYKLGIEDTARVVPVHAIGGLWSLISTGLLIGTPQTTCNLHATFEGLCYCELRLPLLNYGERFLSQLIASIMMIGFTSVVCILVYGFLYLLPIRPFVWILSRVLFLRKHGDLSFEGNWLLTSPDEDQMAWGAYNMPSSISSSYAVHSSAASTPLWARRRQVIPGGKTAETNSSSKISSDGVPPVHVPDGSPSLPQERDDDMMQSRRYGSISWRRRGGTLTTDDVEIANSIEENSQN